MKKKTNALLVVSSLLVAGLVTACGGPAREVIEADPLNRETVITDFSEAPAGFIASSGYGNGGPFGVTWSDSCVEVANNELSLSVKEAPTDGEYPYLGAEYRSLDFYGYGDYSVRMKPSNAYGTVSTFFSYTGEWDSEELHPSTGVTDTRNEDNPEGGWDEIDIEFLGKDTTKVQFNYYVASQNGVGHEFMYDLGFDASLEYHTYGYRWTSEAITWFVDDTPVHQVKASETTPLPSLPGRMMLSEWVASPQSEGWAGKFNGDYGKPAKYDSITCTAQGKHTNKEPTQGETQPTVDWSTVEAQELVRNAASNDAYQFAPAADNKSGTITYSEVTGQSYINIMFDIPADIPADANVVHFEIENKTANTVEFRADVNQASVPEGKNTSAINKSATMNGTPIATDTEWGGSNCQLGANAVAAFDIVYDGTPANLMFMIDSAYQAAAVTHSGELAISNFKFAKLETTNANKMITLSCEADSGYTVESGMEATVSYETMTPNTYKNFSISSSDLAGQVGFSMSVTNNTTEESAIEVTVLSSDWSTKLTAESTCDYYNADSQACKFVIGAGATRTIEVNYEDPNSVAGVIMIMYDSAWAETSTPRTNGSLTLKEFQIKAPIAPANIALGAEADSGYTVVPGTTATVTYETMTANTYKNFNVQDAALLDGHTKVEFDVTNNGTEETALEIQVLTSDWSTKIQTDCGLSDYYNADAQQTKWVIGAGQTRHITLTYDANGATAGVLLFMMDSAWAETNVVKTNGSITITNMFVA